MNYWTTDRFGMLDVENYGALHTHFNNQKPWRGSNDRPFGKRKYSNRRMRMLDDGSIELEYMGHPLVRWHPDGEVSVKAYDCQRNGAFDYQALPKGVRVMMGARTGPVIYVAHGDNRDYWVKEEKPVDQRRSEWDTHTYRRNPNIKYMRAEKPVRLRLDTAIDGWVPVDERKVEPFRWYEPDSKAARKATKEYGLADFTAAAQAMLKLGADVETAQVRWRNAIAYSAEETRDEVIEALKQRDVTTVLRHVRLAETRSRWDPVQGRYVHDESTDLSSSDVQALRDRIYVIAGCVELNTQHVVDSPTWARIERLLKRFGHPA